MGVMEGEARTAVANRFREHARNYTKPSKSELTSALEYGFLEFVSIASNDDSNTLVVGLGIKLHTTEIVLSGKRNDVVRSWRMLE